MIPLTADMSVAPELAQLAGSALPVPAQEAQAAAWAAGPTGPEGQPAQLTLGTLSRGLRIIAATPERWWGLVRFETDRAVEVTVEQGPGYRAWLVVLPPQDAGRPCGCDVATMIAGQ